MRVFVFLLSLVFVSPAFACEGYQNAMSALEQAVQSANAPKKYSKTPPIASINRSIEKLEKAIEEDRRAKAATARPQHAKSM